MAQNFKTIEARINNFFVKSYFPDFKQLSWMRVLIGLVGIIDILTRLVYFKTHYSQDGGCPLNTVGHSNNPVNWLYELNSSSTYYYLLFGIHLLLYLVLISGWKSNIVSFLLWIMTCSLIFRNPFITQGGDELLKMTLLWGVFLPWSKTSPWSKKIIEFNKKEESFYSIIYFAFLVQIACVYFFSGILKGGDDWRVTFNALYYVFSLDSMTWPLGHFLKGFHPFLQFMSMLAWGFEIFIPFILIIPNKVCRWIGVLFILGFHLFIGMTILVGIFFMVGISTAIGLIQRNQDDYRITEVPLKKIRIWILEAKKYLIYILLFYVLYYNIWNTHLLGYELSHGFEKPVQWFQVQQNWGMFAANVYKEDGWLVGKATLQNGYVIDVFTNQSVDFKKPSNLLKRIDYNDRQRKFIENFSTGNFTWGREYYCNFLLKEYNKSHVIKIIKLELIQCKETSLAPEKEKEEKVDQISLYAIDRKL